MNLLDTLTPSNFRPNQSQARKVTFKSPEDIKADREASIEKEEKREAYRQKVIEKVRFNNWSRKRATQVKKVKSLRDQLNRALKLLEVIDSEKPLPLVVGIPVFCELESLHVVEKKKIPSSSQSPSK